MTFEKTYAYTILAPSFPHRVHLNEPLSLHSSFGVGGQADLWLTVETRRELSDLICTCTQQHWPLLVVGLGSNILYADAGVRGIVARMDLQTYEIEKRSDTSALLIAEAGVRWSPLLDALAPLGWGGLAFGIGIPGTLGAGIISNVGAHQQELSEALEWIDVLDARACNRKQEEASLFPVIVLRRYYRDELDLRYRHSRFRNQRLAFVDEHGHVVFPSRGLIDPAEMVVTLALRVQQQDPGMLRALLDHYKQQRRQDDPAQRHLGSIFKNPPGTTARSLLEQAGLAGRRRGAAHISTSHANYIVNHGDGNAADIAALLVEAHQRVLAQYGIALELNVELIGEWE
jgi:UDP-N-acetylmuramate dehydrogenase